MKDLFSANSQLYQQARPSYPISVMQEIMKHVSEHHFAWDCGAGSGQFTQLLAPYFDYVVATDVSADQLQHAPYFKNVSYQVQPAEHTTFAARSFDLITVAQAIHWFDFDAFYKEVHRTLKPDGILAVVGYGLIQVQDPIIHTLIQDLYFKILNGYWDPERRYIDENYSSIPFPFEALAVPEFNMQYQWSAAQLLNYIQTWSAVKHYQQQNQRNPLQALEACLELQTGHLRVEFPVLLRLGRLLS